MNIATLLEMAADGMGDRVAVGPTATGMTYAGLYDASRRLATVVRQAGAERLVLVDVNSEDVPTLLFGAGLAGVPFVPLNYRLSDEHLRSLMVRTPPALAVVDDAVPARVGALSGVEYVTRTELRASSTS